MGGTAYSQSVCRLSISRAVRGPAAGLAVALGLLPFPSAEPACAAAPTLAFLPIKLLDTSAEPTDQGAVHGRRLAALAAGLAGDLGADGSYRTLTVPAETLRRDCPDETPACLLAAARAAGAHLVFVGVVHKSSTLIMQMWARIVNGRTGEALFSRELTFRGDTDLAWQRAEAFLAEQIRSDPPRVSR